MTAVRLRGLVGLVLIEIVAGCSSALREPPPVAELTAGAGRAAAATADPASLVAEADRELDRRPDAAAVRRAQALYLRAASLDHPPAEAFIGAAEATGWLVEHEPDGGRRTELAIQGVQLGQWCRRLYPTHPECTYRLALAVGQQARERPATAVDGLDVMVELLEEVIARDPELDFAGGHRVLALVLLRAPGWPTGPGDPELGLGHAREAAAAFPDYPPNQLVLGEALLANGDDTAGRAALERGIDLANGPDAGPEAADWVAEAEEALAAVR